MSTLLPILISYLLGSIPTGAIVGKMQGVDLRTVGSGNIGFTNVLRTLGAKAAAPVLAVDIGKGLLAVLVVARALGASSPLGPTGIALAAGLAAVAGHIWPVFAGFRGGRGVATACGVFLGLAPLATLAAAAVWLTLVLTTRYVSVGSIVAAALLPFAVAVEVRARTIAQPTTIIVAAAVVAAALVLKHRANIQRLMRGEENRFGGSDR